MHNSLNAPTEPYNVGPDQDSYIAINVEGIIVGHCPTDAEIAPWLECHAEYHLLITSTAMATSMLGKPLPDGDIDVVLL